MEVRPTESGFQTRVRLAIKGSELKSGASPWLGPSDEGLEAGSGFEIRRVSSPGHGFETSTSVASLGIILEIGFGLGIGLEGKALLQVSNEWL